MRDLKTHFKKLGEVTFFVMFFALFLQGCVQSPKTKRSTSNNASTTTTKDTNTTLPEFTVGNNFIQNGSNVSTSIVNLNTNFSDYLQLRGKDVDGYIRNTGTQNVACLIARFNTPTNKVLILAAIPRSINNTTTKVLEYFYNLSPGDITTNQSFCQKTGLINQLNILYPSLTPIYSLADVCTTAGCSSSVFTSLGMDLYNTTGATITQVATKQLLLNLTVSTTSSNPIGQSCTESSTCIAQGYNCCSLGQCVKDLALKPGVTLATPGYPQALQDILNNPTNIYLYPGFYFLCSQPTTNPTTPVDTTNPNYAAQKRLKRLADLYNCTNKIEGEYGVCTTTQTVAELNTIYYAGLDDRNFKNTFTNSLVDDLTLSAIEQITYGDVVLYDYNLKTEAELSQNIYEDDSVKIVGAHNDDLISGTEVTIKSPAPSNAVSKELVIRYKIDASCTKVNNALAKCEKYYMQGQRDNSVPVTDEVKRRGRVTDHYPDFNVFKLPPYADISKNITVDVDGISQKQDIDWQLVIAGTNTIQFINNAKAFKDQKVRISYFVNTSIAGNNVMLSKDKALTDIKATCGCTGTSECGLKPILNSDNQVTDYACVFPDPAPVEPAPTQLVYLSSKSVPVRFFDELGVSQKAVTASTSKQEGKLFEYRKGNLLNPNNAADITLTNDTNDNYVGFNEIYGSLSYANNSAKPAQEVPVVNGRTYDIYVDGGVLSNCIQCGNDYYSNLTKIFPLTQFGGGTVPLLGQTNRSMTNGTRADDLSFGRACLVPATMLPWTHRVDSDAQKQRLGRLSAQHFLFANGYQHDWYGFDYGSVIGSFDGVKWFSIGTNRRIKATTNKMFIAVNALMGDLTVENTYKVTVTDGALNPAADTMITSDFQSNGAECQQYHVCSSDNDCATTLGWDYACAPVGEITTSWPKFDANAKEIPDVSSDDNRLASILGISNTQKRCVYRGRGAACTPNYNAINVNSTFNQSTAQAMHACSANNYCQTTATNGTAAPKFNNRIARYGAVRATTTADTFGLAALLPGRPYSYNPTELPTDTALRNLNANKALALCMPGRDVELTNFLDQNRLAPASTEFSGDKVLNLGMSYRKNTPIAADNYLMSCSIMDPDTKTFYHNSTTNAAALFSSTLYPNLKYDSGSQAISTNALNIFNSIFSNKGINFGLYKNNTTLLTTPSFTENRCLRAPGASCFTDMDCAPSKVLSDKIKSLSTADTTVTAILNAYEIKFWQEDLVCSQAIDKASNQYDPKNNRCCREAGKTISIASSDISNGINMTKVPGVDYGISAKSRYSRSATMYKEVNTDGGNFPELRVAVKDQCLTGACQSTAGLANQFRTFASFAEKTSCSGSWIRNFSTGTHKWEVARFQTFSPTMFKCMNWFPGAGGYSCSGDPDDPACGLVQTSPASPKARGIFDFLGRLELTGIPQIALETEAFFSKNTEEAMSCRSYPGDRNHTYPDHPTAPATFYTYPPNLFATSFADKEYVDATKGQMYSAADGTNFSANYKQIFKADEVVGCMPAGTTMPAGSDPALCCTGTIMPETNKCQLPDYIDLSIYTNRYVSSEAKTLNLSSFDSNGYVKDPANVATIACAKQMCASGYVAFGILVSRLQTPGLPENDDNKAFRFFEGIGQDDNNGLLTLYNKGLKLNTHAYCLPKATATNATAAKDLTIRACN